MKELAVTNAEKYWACVIDAYPGLFGGRRSSQTYRTVSQIRVEQHGNCKVLRLSGTNDLRGWRTAHGKKCQRKCR
jgi:hypothetical protein